LWESGPLEQLLSLQKSKLFDVAIVYPLYSQNKSKKATSNNWFRSENEDLRMDGKALEVSSIG
jgi:hypothetical protein